MKTYFIFHAQADIFELVLGLSGLSYDIMSNPSDSVTIFDVASVPDEVNESLMQIELRLNQIN